MEHDIPTQMVALCDAYAAHLNITHWRVSYLARGDGQFFNRLRQGAGCTTRTAKGVFDWFSANWPADLEWPPSIPRPKTKEAA